MFAKFKPNGDPRNDNQEAVWINPRAVFSVEPQWKRDERAGSIITGVGGAIERVAEPPETVIAMLGDAARE